MMKRYLKVAVALLTVVVSSVIAGKYATTPGKDSGGSLESASGGSLGRGGLAFAGFKPGPGGETVNYVFHQAYLAHIVVNCGLPLPPCFTSTDPQINELSASHALTAVPLQGTRMRLRINDYWWNRYDPGKDCQGTWVTFADWARDRGFEVFIDNEKGVDQIGCACGMVAARCLSWFKHGRPGDPYNGDFMKMNTHSAVSGQVVRAANAKLLERAPPPQLAERGSLNTWMLSGDEVRNLVDWLNQPHRSTDEQALGYVQGPVPWDHGDLLTLEQKALVRPWWENERNSELFLRTGGEHQPSQYALLSVPLDDLYVRVARDVKAVASGEKDEVKRYIIANCEDSRHIGNHWVSVVYEIVKDDTEENAMAATTRSIHAAGAITERHHFDLEYSAPYATRHGEIAHF